MIFMTSLSLRCQLIIFKFGRLLSWIMSLTCIKIDWVLEAKWKFFIRFLFNFCLRNLLKWSWFFSEGFKMNWNLLDIFNVVCFMLYCWLYQWLRKFSFVLRLVMLYKSILIKKSRKIVCLLSCSLLLFLCNWSMQISLAKCVEILRQSWLSFSFDINYWDQIWLATYCRISYEGRIVFW